MYHKILSALFILIPATVACGLPAAEPTELPDAVFTTVAQTIEAQLTQTAAQNPVPQNTPLPPTFTSAPPTNTLSPVLPTNTPQHCNVATFMADVTIPDGTTISPGQTFTKTWKLRNVGTCTWTSSYQLVFDRGDQMGGLISQQLTTGSVAPGQDINISVNLTAPNTAGTYRGYWRLKDATGTPFALTSGNSFYVHIKVGLALSTTVVYSHPVAGYKLELPRDWPITESDMRIGSNQEVTFSPPNPEPFIAYLSISLDNRALDQIIKLYAQSVPGAARENVFFNGYPGIKYSYAHQGNVYRIEYYIPYNGRIHLIATDRPNDAIVQSILTSFRFTAAPQPVTYEAAMADNGKTFVMNIGDKLRLNLDSNYYWSAISVSNPAVLMGADDGYFAIAGGTATLTATGNPGCLYITPPCGLPSILFTITVTVP